MNANPFTTEQLTFESNNRAALQGFKRLSSAGKNVALNVRKNGAFYLSYTAAGRGKPNVLENCGNGTIPMMQSNEDIRIIISIGGVLSLDI